MRRSWVAAFAAAAAALGACGSGTDPSTWGPPAPWHAVDSVPPTTGGEVVLVPGGAACTTDSYLHRIHCFVPGRDGRVSFGREGAGPGEFRTPTDLVPVEGSDSTLGVVDIELLRLSLFTVDGRFLGSVPTPPVFWPVAGIREGRLVGVALGWQPPRSGPEETIRMAIVDTAAGGRIEDLRLSPPEDREDQEDPGRPLFARGVYLSDGELILHLGAHRFLRYGLDGTMRDSFEYPPHLQAPIYPSERDREEYAVALRRLQGSEPSALQLEEYASRPLTPVLVGTNPMEGPAGTVWIASSRGRLERSFLDVFQEGAYLGTVAVRDRLLDFDVQGDTLVTLVERHEDDSGLAVRGLDWYDVGAWPGLGDPAG